MQCFRRSVTFHENEKIPEQRERERAAVGLSRSSVSIGPQASGVANFSTKQPHNLLLLQRRYNIYCRRLRSCLYEILAFPEAWGPMWVSSVIQQSPESS